MDISNLLNFIPFLTIDHQGKSHGIRWQRIIELAIICTVVAVTGATYLSKITSSVETMKVEIQTIQAKDIVRDQQMYEINRQLGILIGKSDK